MNENSDFLNLLIERDTLLHQLNESRKKEKYTDVKLQIGDKLFPVHRNVLAHSSPVLEAQLSEQWSTTTVYPLSDQYVEAEIMEDLLSFLYTGNIKLTPDNVHSVSMAAHYLQIPGLLVPSVKYLSQLVTDENVLTLLRFSTFCELTEIQERCWNFIKANNEVVLNNSQIFVFSFKELKELVVGLKERFVGTKLRENTFHCVVRWVEKNLPEGSGQLPDLLKNIPLEELSMKFLAETVSVHPLVKRSIDCIETVSEALANYETYSKQQNLILIGGIKSGKNRSRYDMDCYDTRTGVWESLPDVPSHLFTSCLAVINQHDIIVHSKDPRNFVEQGYFYQSIEVFDWDSQSWTKLPEIPIQLESASIGTFKGDLYLAGSECKTEDPPEYEPKVLCYSFVTKQWKIVASMKHEREYCPLIEYKDHLYAIGDKNKGVEKYDPVRNEWTMMASPTKLFSFLSATLHQGKIYAGAASCAVLPDGAFEMFDPETNTWTELPTPLVSSHNASLVSLNGKLLTVGGTKLSDKATTDSIYEFDFSTQTWIESDKMTVARSFHHAVVGTFY